jgi:hypothetical protein
VHLAILTHCNQYAYGFRRGALHGRPRRVGRRVARKSADLRGGRHVSRTAALSAADPTESYAPGKSHEISRCTPCPASVPKEDDTKCYARTLQYAPSSPHRSPYVGEPYWASLIRMVRAARQGMLNRFLTTPLRRGVSLAVPSGSRLRSADLRSAKAPRNRYSFDHTLSLRGISFGS